MAKKSGFTIIELLIVIAIIGSLAAVLIPNFLNARKRSIETATQSFARQVVSWIAAADSAAMTAADQTALQSITQCTGGLLAAEGAPASNASMPEFISTCVVAYNFATARYTVTAVSQNGYTSSVTY